MHNVVMPPSQTESCYVSLVRAEKVASVRNPRKGKMRKKQVDWSVILLSLLLPLLTITIIIISVEKKNSQFDPEKNHHGHRRHYVSGQWDLPWSSGCTRPADPRPGNLVLFNKYTSKGVRLNMVKCGFMVLNVLKCCYMWLNIAKCGQIVSKTWSFAC